MKSVFKLLMLLFISFSIKSCNTLYNAHLINIEIVEPGKFLLPEKYSIAAIKNNNCNVAYNPTFASYYIDSLTNIDNTNIDSIAAEIYFYTFVQQLQQQIYFDSIIEISPGNYSNTYFKRNSEKAKSIKSDSLYSEISNNKNIAIDVLSNYITTFQSQNQLKTDTFNIDSDLGLYSKKDLKEIADSTEADLLISLDYFTSIDRKTFQDINYKYYLLGNFTIFSTGFWNFYNLQTQELEFFYHHIDTLTWEASGLYKKEINSFLPPRKDAILNAAEVSGERFVNLLVPHWLQVQRLYYRSGQYELKETEQFIKEGKWLKAAEIWKANIDNPNKKVVAKCMFNLAVACEMEGDLDAAIDWAVKSFYIFGNKNRVHAENCQNYLNILAQRKLDLKKIDLQLKTVTELP